MASCYTRLPIRHIANQPVVCSKRFPPIRPWDPGLGSLRGVQGLQPSSQGSPPPDPAVTRTMCADQQESSTVQLQGCKWLQAVHAACSTVGRLIHHRRHLTCRANQWTSQNFRCSMLLKPDGSCYRAHRATLPRQHNPRLHNCTTVVQLPAPLYHSYNLCSPASMAEPLDTEARRLPMAGDWPQGLCTPPPTADRVCPGPRHGLPCPQASI